MNAASTMRTEGVSQAVVRAGRVLLAFDGDRPALTTAEVAATSRLNRSTAHRMLRSLEFAGLIRRQDNVFSLAPVVLRLGDAYLSQLKGLADAAGPVLERLRDATRETAALHVREGLSRVVVRQVESRHELRRHYPDIGKPIPLHSGAPSRAILAFLTDEEIDAYLAGALGFDDPPDGHALRDDTRTVRKAGYALSRGQRTVGVASVAAPIFDGTGRVIGALNVSGPAGRFDDGAVRRFARLVIRAAGSLSEALGHTSPLTSLRPAGSG